MSTSVLQKQFIHANAVGQPTAEGLSFKLLRRRNSSPSPLGAIGETKWLVSRWFDLFFVCGLAPWIFGALFFLSNGANGAFKSGLLLQQPMTILFIGSSLLIGESHQFTSIIRYYTSFRKREKKYRLQRVPFWIIYSIFGVTILMTMGGFGVRTEFFGLGWTFQLLQFFALMAVFAFPAVLLQHVCAQAIAIVQVYCRNSGYSVSDNERGTLNATSWLLTCVGMFSIAMPFGMNRSGFFGIEPEQLPTYATAFAVVAVAAGVNVGNLAIRRGLQTGEWPPIAGRNIVCELNVVHASANGTARDDIRLSIRSAPVSCHSTLGTRLARESHKFQAGAKCFHIAKVRVVSGVGCSCHSCYALRSVFASHFSTSEIAS